MRAVRIHYLGLSAPGLLVEEKNVVRAHARVVLDEGLLTVVSVEL